MFTLNSEGRKNGCPYLCVYVCASMCTVVHLNPIICPFGEGSKLSSIKCREMHMNVYAVRKFEKMAFTRKG